MKKNKTSGDAGDVNDELIPQQHLLPKTDGYTKRIGSMHNQLDQQKLRYIINMRKSLCKDNICFPDGSLNLKYFNVKKGHYWSHKENQKLIQGVMRYGACEFKKIKKEYLKEWTETEIRLRICKLLRRYNLEEYRETQFVSKEQILKEAKRNREEAQKLDDERINGKKGHNSRSSHVQASFMKPNRDQPKLVGGIYFNPVPLEELNREHNEGGNSLVNNFFTKKTQ